MNQESEFPFDGQRPVEDHRARRVTPEENQKFRAAISAQFGVELKKRVGAVFSQENRLSQKNKEQ
jgi:hypothetical protein